jgi:RimJ/RimL family protein N-acetyltransferase
MVIETERLILKEFDTGDSEFILRLLNTPGWLKYVGTRNISTLEDAEAYITGKLMPGYKDLGFGFYLVQLKDSLEKIGMCGLTKRETLDDADIGFAFLPEFEGKGYAFEAASASVQFAKNTLGLNQLAAITVPINKPSIRLLEKLGMKYDKTVNLPDDNETLMYFKMDLRENNE